MNTESILKKAIDYYGNKSQMIMFFEELMELYEAINRGDREDIIEEIADVSVCLKQILIIFNLTDDHFPSGGDDEDFYEIMTNSILFVCRASRGRHISPEPLWLLSGWLRSRACDMNAIEEVKRVAGEKIERLRTRMQNG